MKNAFDVNRLAIDDTEQDRIRMLVRSAKPWCDVLSNRVRRWEPGNEITLCANADEDAHCGVGVVVTDVGGDFFQVGYGTIREDQPMSHSPRSTARRSYFPISRSNTSSARLP